MTREESRATVAAAEGEEVAKAIAVDEAMEEVVAAPKQRVGAEMPVPVRVRWDDEMVAPF